jgi:hypothetical protein
MMPKRCVDGGDDDADERRHETSPINQRSARRASLADDRPVTG